MNPLAQNVRRQVYAHDACHLTALRLSAVADGSVASALQVRLEHAAVSRGTPAPTRDRARARLGPAPVAFLDRAFLGCAWELGAWDVERVDHAALGRAEDFVQRLRGQTALVDASFALLGRHDGTAELDVGSWIRAASRMGWVSWSCKPMWRHAEERRPWLMADTSLRADGTREPGAEPSPGHPPDFAGHDRRLRIQLGVPSATLLRRALPR